jgi:hypothetical protein
VEVETTITLTENGHIRKHTVICDDDAVAYDCSFAVPADVLQTENGRAGSITGNGETILIKCKPNMNLMNPETVMEAVKYQLSKGVHQLETIVTYPKE